MKLRSARKLREWPKMIKQFTRLNKNQSTELPHQNKATQTVDILLSRLL